MATKTSSFDPTLFGISAGLDSTNDFDNTAAFANSLGLNEDPFFPSNWDEDTPPYDGGLYSTPLNWDPPMPKQEEEVRNLAPTYTNMNVLTPAQQEKLRSIAMPQHLRYQTQVQAQAQTQHSPNSTASYKSPSTSSPEAIDQSRKRKSSAEADEDDDDDSASHHPPVKKTAHNMIEKRYRTNLNDKIAALRDSVPSLRIMQKSARGEDTADDREELQGLTPAHKLNKATVLSKATEYIRHLEKRNSRLQDENAQMKTRINAFEKLFVSGSMGFAPIQQPMNHYQFAPGFNTPGPSPSSDQGMIPVPDDMRRLHGQMSQEAFAVPTQYNQNRQPLGPNGWQGGGYFGKLMVGSLAGLMIMQGFHEAEQDTDAPGARGLFAFPAHVLKLFSYHLHSALDFHYQGYHVPASQTIHFLQVLLVAGLIFYVFLPSLVAPKPKSTGSKTTQLAAAPSLASSIQVRRQAWLTAIQTVWVPRHNFFLEAAALCMKVGKFTLRNIVGSSLYSWATGATEEQEAARVKAWTIALDAQLTGGDVEVSKSRLTLTLLASGTLPDTPARLMLKALHIRVLLWEIGNTSFAGPYIQKAARELARWKWNEAKQLQQILSHSKEQQDELPEYIATILEQKCDDVLVDAIVQRAYNLAWNLPTTNNTEVNCGMDRVVEDFAIRSPLDAVAAWSSSLTLHRALAKSLGAEAEGATASKSIGDEIDISIKTAPPGSTAQLRALVARAVLVKDKRGKSIAIALKALGAGQQKAPIQSNVNIKMAITNLPDIQTSIHCAMALAYLERYPMPANPDNAPKIINSIVPANLTLLGFTAMFKLIEKMHDHTLIASTCANALGRFAGSLRIWVGGKEGEKSGLETELKRAMVEKCLTITAQALGMEKDAGYETMSDDGDSEGC